MLFFLKKHFKQTTTKSTFIHYNPTLIPCDSTTDTTMLIDTFFINHLFEVLKLGQTFIDFNTK